ncbi:hypothetical protein CAEBREN_02734 [Caenorhabditis brenneri]|uniref:SET domain-containing protein n=1 Tax=Caenorhabditis brenneri TaxID=135651 RepID=G0MQK0_CAEBE|nr:hypothetical protein CAEBREN_02734 [Caenorhabditis brenneri]
MDVRGDNRGVPREMMEPHVNYYPEDEHHQIRQPPANRLFQPIAYEPPVYVPPQPEAINVQEVDLPNRDQNQGEDEVEEDDEEHMSRFDANEDTVWIDSDGDELTEEIILKQNFFLPYSDHNYDMPTPEERVIHPEEGPFPIIGGLDEQGNVIRQYMPPGYEAYGEEFGVPDELELADRAAAAEEARQHQQHLQFVQQQYQLQPHVVQQHYQLQPHVYAVPPVARNHMMYQPELGIAEPNNRAAPMAAILRETQQGQEHVVTRREQQQNHQDHNYDTSDPWKRTTHPQERSLPNIGGLDEEAGYEADGEEFDVPNKLEPTDRVAAATEEEQVSGTGAPVENNSDSESEEIEGDGEENDEMRCHCGMDHGCGPCIRCDVCRTWQHMKCMGLDGRKNLDKYTCEKCDPRELGVSRDEARQGQIRYLKKKEAEAKRKEVKKREKEEKSKNKQNQEPSRNPAPPPPQQHQQQRQQARVETRVPQLNDYSAAAAQLLATLNSTAGAEELLEDARCHKKARRMFVEENVEALVTTEVVSIRQVLLEMNGHVSMSNEVKRQPGGGNSVFMYDGLMKNISGKDIGDHKELVCVDTKEKGNDSRFARRSCIPNCVLRHVLGSQATLGIMIVATKDIHRSVEVTLPFDADWRDSDVPLECADHLKELHMCPFEAERRRYAKERHRSQETERRNAEEARRADEERRRLEDEVRLERAAGFRQMDEKVKLERMAPLPKKAERACKKEAEKKLEAEGKASEKKPSRNPAPPPPQQHQQQRQQARVETRVPQLNDYSAAAAQLLATKSPTAGADTLLEDARCHKKARRMFVEENVEALVTTEVVSISHVLLEMNGHVSMSNEVKRQPGGGNSVFMYDGLMKDTSGKDIGDHKELVCVDTKKNGNDSRFVRRSCVPNCVLKHVLGSQATLGIMIVATKDIHRNVEVTLPFDADWRDSDVPLECAEHLKELQKCTFEAERRRYANERHRSQETGRRAAEEYRRAREEIRRLEDEIRQIDEEAEQERMALNCVKKTENDKADNKKLKRMAQLPKKAEHACEKEVEKKLRAEGMASEKKRKVAAETNGVESKRTRR